MKRGGFIATITFLGIEKRTKLFNSITFLGVKRRKEAQLML